MMRKYIKYIPNTVNYDLFPYKIIYSDARCHTIVGVIRKKYGLYVARKIIYKHTGFIAPLAEGNYRRLYDSKMSKSIANIIIREIMKCT